MLPLHCILTAAQMQHIKKQYINVHTYIHTISTAPTATRKRTQHLGDELVEHFQLRAVLHQMLALDERRPCKCMHVCIYVCINIYVDIYLHKHKHRHTDTDTRTQTHILHTSVMNTSRQRASECVRARAHTNPNTKLTHRNTQIRAYIHTYKNIQTLIRPHTVPGSWHSKR